MLLIVNDDAAARRDVDADGVHVGEDDGEHRARRARSSAGRMVGVSCYDDLERAPSAVAQGADYVAFGSFFPSTVKPEARRAARWRCSRRSLDVPVIAIGGITADNTRRWSRPAPMPSP